MDRGRSYKANVASNVSQESYKVPVNPGRYLFRDLFWHEGTAYLESWVCEAARRDCKRRSLFFQQRGYLRVAFFSGDHG
jgi:hypothetical protein